MSQPDVPRLSHRRPPSELSLAGFHFDDFAKVPEGGALLDGLFFLGLGFVGGLHGVAATVHAGDVATPAVFVFNDGWTLATGAV